MAQSKIRSTQIDTDGNDDISSDAEVDLKINSLIDNASTQGNTLGKLEKLIQEFQNQSTGLSYTPINKAGDTMQGSLGLPSSIGMGLLVEDGYGWRDLIGEVTPRSTTNTAPVLKNFLGSIREWSYSADDEGDCRYHIPHDYAPGTDLYIHVHWGHNGTNILGALQLDIQASYAKGHQRASFSTQIVNQILVNNLNITNTPRYFHRVDEIKISTPGGSSSLLDTSLIEVDGFILLKYVTTVIPSISGSDTTNAPFIFGVDIHYQSTNMPTKNKSPSFYG